jgi:trafficking protein particle complex subunit 5
MAHPSTSVIPGSPASSSTRTNIIPPNASSATFPISPRANVPGYVRRSSAALSGNFPPLTPSSGQSFNAGNVQSSTTTLGPDILERPRDRTRTNEVSASSLAFLFAEMVSYTQNRVSGISDLEKK